MVTKPPVPTSAVDPNFATVRPVHTGKDLDEGRLAGTVVTDKPNGFTAPQLETDVAKRMHARIPLLESKTLDKWRRRF